MSGSSLSKLLPNSSVEAGPETEFVTSREFDLTALAKKLVPVIPITVAAVLGALEAIPGLEIVQEPAVVVGVLGVVAFTVVGLAVVSAADILGRSMVEAARPAPTTESTVGDRADEGAEAERKWLDEQAGAQRAKADRLAEEERERLEAVRAQEDKLAAEERDRLDKRADAERSLKDKLADEERNRLDERAEEKRSRLNLAATEELARLGALAKRNR